MLYYYSACSIHPSTKCLLPALCASSFFSRLLYRNRSCCSFLVRFSALRSLIFPLPTRFSHRGFSVFPCFFSRIFFAFYVLLTINEILLYFSPLRKILRRHCRVKFDWKDLLVILMNICRFKYSQRQLSVVVSHHCPKSPVCQRCIVTKPLFPL